MLQKMEEPIYNALLMVSYIHYYYIPPYLICFRATSAIGFFI